MSITTFEGVMGSGKSLTANALAYIKFYNREMERFCFQALKSGAAPKDVMELLAKDYDVDRSRAETYLGSAIRAIKTGVTEIPRLKIITNTVLNIKDEKGQSLVTKFDTEYFLAHVQDLEMMDCILMWDEAYLYMDSRSSGSKMNKLTSYFIAQTRKRDVDMFVCVQHIDLVDKRLRRAVDERGTCRYRKESPCTACNGLGKTEKKGRNGDPGESIQCSRCLGYGETGWATSVFWNKRTGERKRIKIFGPAVFWLFDTKELIPMQGKSLQIKAEDL